MRLIDADEVKETIRHRTKLVEWQKGIIWALIDMHKTVDAVPVIRCKDCKFSKAYYHGPESNLGMFTYLCTQGLYGMNADDYCSRAERKEE